MSTTIAPASKVEAAFDTVCDAIKDVHDEASLWRLSDELVRIAPQGVKAVEAVVAQAAARGIPTKSVNTLRLYRDVAIRFPANERVSGVSFSAHREAIVLGTTAEAVQVLNDLVTKHGAAGVTVTTVKSAVQASTGKVPAAKQSVKPQSALADVARDLSAGGKHFASELDTLIQLNGVTLDGLHAGLSHVLTVVESKRAKAVRKAAAEAAKAAKATPKVQPAKAGPRNGKAVSKAAPRRQPVKAGAGKAGDLRDL
jgi:hypothetical protein